MKEKYLGIDEAGRGSLIGPMVIAGVVIDKEQEHYLKEKGVKDSKELTPEKRKELEKIIKEHSIWYKIVKVYPTDIDKNNLNKLTLKHMKKIAEEAIKKHPDIKTIIVDQVGFRKKTLLKQQHSITQIMEKKADSKYIPVSAASILAKVERDRIIEYYRKKYGLKGSGYPSDQETMEWLITNSNKIPREIIRVKWKTLRKHGVDVKSKKLDDFLR